MLDAGEAILMTAITTTDGRAYLIRQTHHDEEEDWEESWAIARRLKRGETYDFPDVLKDEYTLAGKEPHSTMLPLAAFVGEWTICPDGEPNPKYPGPHTLRYFWKSDGKGIWCEAPQLIDAGDKDGSKKLAPSFTLITHDAAADSYLLRESSPQMIPAKYKMTWDDKGRTLIAEAPTFYPVAGSTMRREYRLISPDRIDWRHKTTKADGTIVAEATGHYERIKP